VQRVCQQLIERNGLYAVLGSGGINMGVIEGPHRSSAWKVKGGGWKVQGRGLRVLVVERMVFGAGVRGLRLGFMVYAVGYIV